MSWAAVHIARDAQSCAGLILCIATSRLQPRGAYSPRFLLNTAVMRIPIVPGTDPRQSYGDLSGEDAFLAMQPACGVLLLYMDAWCIKLDC